jgi:archaellin
MCTLFSRTIKSQIGISRLETGIILIALVVFTAAFTYAALSTGLLSIQKGQAVASSSQGEARSPLELIGGVTAIASTTGNAGSIQQISFVVSKAVSSGPIDFTTPTANITSNNGLAARNRPSKITINYRDDSQMVQDLYWTAEKMGNTDADSLLENNESFKITIGSDIAGSDGGNLIDALDPALTASKTFDLEVLTPGGEALVIKRTIPAYINNVNNLG